MSDIDFSHIVDYNPNAAPSNLVDAMLSRVSHVYADAPVLNDVLRSLLEQHESLESTLRSMLDTFTLETAVGNQLDIIGLFIGLPRTVCNVYHEGSTDPGAPRNQFGNYMFTDDSEYRKFLIAIIYSNNFDGTLAAYTRIVQYLWDGIDITDPASTGETFVSTFDFGTIEIAVPRVLTVEENRKAELYKYVLPYYGALNVRVLHGTDYFMLNCDDKNTGLTRPFAYVV